MGRQTAPDGVLLEVPDKLCMSYGLYALWFVCDYILDKKLRYV